MGSNRILSAQPANGLACLAAAFTVAGTSPADAQAPPQPAAEDRLDEIVVTARRRSEPLQRTPVSVVALTEKDLEARSVTNTRALQNFVPNLTFAPSQNIGEGAGNIFIRGIGQEDFSIGADPGVGLYVDGVYLARAFGTIMNLTDVARVEVLRGPQGTLFGKNTVGGAINILSNPPRDSRERVLKVILGNFDRIESRAVVNEPLSERLFMRLAIGAVRRDGYLRRLPPPAPLDLVEQANDTPADLRREGNDRSLAARLQLRWLLTDSLTADLSIDASRKRNTQGAEHIDFIDPRFGVFPELNQLIRMGRLPGPEITNDLVRDSLLESYAAGKNYTNQTLWGGSAVITAVLGAQTVKFVGAYRGLRNRVGVDTDLLYFNIGQFYPRVNQRQLSGELQLSGVTGGLSYTAGLFVIGERAKLSPTAAFADIFYTCGCYYPPGNLPRLSTEPRQVGSDSYAGYAQGTYALTDRLSATLGARYSHERKTLDGQTILFDDQLQLTDIVVARGANRDSWDSVTYRAGLEYQATPDLMAYGSIAKGFKSGGFNIRSAPDLPNMGFYSYKPETALTYEVGLRSEWWNRRLRLNATLFHTDYQDIQLRQQTIVEGQVTTLIENAARARIRGAEIELTAAPVDGLTLGIAYGHLDPEYLDVGRVPGLTVDTPFQRTPRHSFSGSVHYEVPLRSGTLELHTDYSYRSKEQFQILPASNDQDGYGLLGARLTFRAPGDRWAIALFGTNLTDERYRTAGRGTLVRQIGFAYSSVGMPRQVGIQATAKF